MFPKGHLTLHSRMSGSRWSHHHDYLGHEDYFFYRSSRYSYHFLLISSASVRSIPFLPFIVLIFAWNVSLVALIFLKRSLVFPILLFSSVSLHWSLRKESFLFFPCYSLEFSIQLDIFFLFSFAFYFSFFSAVCKTSSDNHFAFLHFFFLGMVLITASCTVSWTSVHSSSGTLSIISNALNLFVIYTV